MSVSSEHLDGFAAHLVARGKQPATVESYCRDAQRFLDFLGRCRIAPTKVEPDTLLAYREHIESDERVNSVRRSIIGIRMFYRYLTQAKVMVHSPFDDVPIPQRNDALPRRLFSKEIETVIEHAISSPQTVTELRNAVIVALLAFEGIKATELIALTWSNYFNGRPATLKIRGTRTRTIQLSGDCHRLIVKYQTAYAKVSRHPTLAASGEKHLIIAFRGRDGSTPIPKITRHGLKFIIYELGKAAGVPHLNTELLRHYAVSYLLSQGRQAEEIMQHLGLRRLGNIAKHIHQQQNIAKTL